MTQLFEMVQQIFNVSLFVSGSSVRKIDIHMACRDGEASGIEQDDSESLLRVTVPIIYNMGGREILINEETPNRSTQT